MTSPLSEALDLFLWLIVSGAHSSNTYTLHGFFSECHAHNAWQSVALKKKKKPSPNTWDTLSCVNGKKRAWCVKTCSPVLISGEKSLTCITFLLQSEGDKRMIDSCVCATFEPTTLDLFGIFVFVCTPSVWSVCEVVSMTSQTYYINASSNVCVVRSGCHETGERIPWRTQ